MNCFPNKYKNKKKEGNKTLLINCWIYIKKYINYLNMV